MNMVNERAVELLAPAGSEAALHAAVAAGADAIYLGLDNFNARRGADNFTLDTLQEACDYAHVRGVRVYLTFNTLILGNEAGGAMECARQAYKRGVDAFIVQDLGMATELRRTLPEAEIHASTQMNIHNVEGIALCADLGMARVTLAREVALDEIAHLCEFAADAGLEIETFAHGALCVCYSGQCLMSSLIGGRSANRGTCAQACRLPYTLQNDARSRQLPAPGEHLLSPKDLCSIDLVGSLVNAGVKSLKLEGRMKSPDYVKAVVSVYRAVLDRVLAAAPEERYQVRATAGERRVLEEAFSRGFTTAYLESQRGNDIMSYQRPNNRGASIGRVRRATESFADVDATLPVVAGDVLEIWTSKGHVAHVVDDAAVRGDGSVRIQLDKGSRDDRAVRQGDRVFRVRSAAAAFEDGPQEPRVAVKAAVDVLQGMPLRMQAVTENRIAGTLFAVAEGPVVEPARTKSVSEQDVRDHVDRLGQTPYYLEQLDVSLDEGSGIGFSQLHHVRADVLDDLTNQVLEPYHARKLPRSERHESLPAKKPQGCNVVVWATNPACARAAKRAGADEVVVPALNYKRGDAVMAGEVVPEADQAGYPKHASIAVPTVDHDPVSGTREAAVGFDAWEHVEPEELVYVDSLAAARRALDMGCRVQTGPRVPAMNSWALESLSLLGVERAWLSPELNLRQIQDLGKASPIDLGITVLGAQELMITEHCLLMSQGDCKQECATCPRRAQRHSLLDRKGFSFPVITDALGRSHLFNSVALDIAHLLPDLVKAGVSAVMVDTTLMNPEQAAQAVGRVVKARNLALQGDETVDKVSAATSGHLFRGVQ